MELKDFEKKFTTIFLADRIYPTKLVLLKRAPDMKFAPNKYTGLGGKIGDKEEFAQETPLESAYRELWEEAGVDNVVLQEIGRLIVNGNKRIVFYYFGVFNQESLSKCPEGTLDWVALNMVLKQDIIPSTKFFLEEWLTGFCNLDPFTLFMERESDEDPESPTINLQLKEGLHYEF